MPAVVFDGGTIFSTKIRLNSGIKRFAIWNTGHHTTKREEWKNGRWGAPCWNIWGHLLGFYKGFMFLFKSSFYTIFVNTRALESSFLFLHFIYIFPFLSFTIQVVLWEIWMNPKNQKMNGSLVLVKNNNVLETFEIGLVIEPVKESSS